MKKRKNNIPTEYRAEKHTLEYVMKYFKPLCPKCGCQMSTHAYRRKTRLKDEIIYASCLTKECAAYHHERAFNYNGDDMTPERQVFDKVAGCSVDNFDWESLNRPSVVMAGG